MAGQSGSAPYQELFESALHAYGRKTGITLAQHPLVVQLQSRHSANDITTLLYGRAPAFRDFRARDKMMKSIKTTVSILTPLSQAAAATFADAIGVVRQKALMARSTPLTLHSDIITTHKSNTCWSRYNARCMCRSLVYL